jgi:serine/threonine protein kinase/Tol biopolymer transport system component
MIGKVVSHYKILEKLGEGGMGVVYKAHDTELDRDVALKFLPRHVTVNEVEQARFLHEARAAAILNHPNICTVYAIEKGDDQPFIVMEYVEGKTLREIVPVKKLQDAITYAIQIAEALQEAHTHGIVHRDIKAENIMVNSKNQVKVMDFGLAKLKGSLKLTKTSSTIGTLAYMAPEQIQGGEVDARNDIFSFGVVLYEMLTGHLPFRGEHEAAMVYSIVNEEPTPIQKYVPGISSELVHIVNRALEKDQEDRYQSAHDAVIDLRRLRKQTTGVHRPSVAGESFSVPPRLLRKGGFFGSRMMWILAGVVTIVIAVTILVLMPSHVPRLNPDMKFSVLQVPFTSVRYPSLSRDGNWVAFPARDEKGYYDIYWMHVSGSELRRVTNDSAHYIGAAAISPDGRLIAYGRSWAGKAEIAVVPTVGGTSRRIVMVGYKPSWRPDGRRIGYIHEISGRLEFWTVNVDGTDNREEFKDSTDFSLFSPWVGASWSPDGKSIAWVHSFPNRTSELVIRELETGKERQLTFDKKNVSDVLWTPQNVIIFSSTKAGNTNLWMISPDGGEAIQITRGSGTDNCGSISMDGKRMIYFQAQSFEHLWTYNVDERNWKQLTFSDEFILGASLSPDKKSIAMAVGDPDYIKVEGHLYLMSRSDGHRQQLTSGNEMLDTPVWSPDGRWIAYVKRSTEEPVDSNRVYLLDANNPTTPLLVGNGLGVMRWTSVTEFLVMRKTQFWRASTTGAVPVPVYEDSTYVIPLSFPEGEFLLSYDMRVNRDGFWIRSNQDLQKKLPGRKLTPYSWGVLSKDGRAMYYYKPPDELWEMELPKGRQSLVMKPVPSVLDPVSISLDGKTLLCLETQRRGKFVIIENLFQ